MDVLTTALQGLEIFLLFLLCKKTVILLVWLLTSIFSSIELYIHKIIYFLPSCTIYYLTMTKPNFKEKKIYSIGSLSMTMLWDLQLSFE